MFTARDLASGVMRRIGMSLDRMGARGLASGRAIQAGLGVAMAGAASLMAGIGILGTAIGAARAAGRFQSEMARVQAISRATAAEMTALRNAAIQAGIATQFSPREAAQGLGELAVRGFQASEAIAALTGVLDFASGGQLSVAQGAQTVGAALRVFQLDADQAGLAADRLLRISNITSLEANDLALALGTVSRGAGLTEQSMNGMLIAMGLVRNTGVQASVAASSVSSALIFMTRNADEIHQRLGVRVTRDLGNGRTAMRDFNEVILEAAQAAGERFPDAAERGAVFSQLFGRFGLTAANAIGRSLAGGVRNATGEMVYNAEALEYLNKQMASAAGTAAEFRRITLDTLNGSIVLLSGSLETLAIVFGEAFARIFQPMVEGLTAAINVIIRFMNAIPESGQTAIAAALLLAGVFFIAGGAAMLFVVALIPLILFIKAVAIALAVAAGIFIPFTAAIVAAVAAVGLFWLAVRRNLGGIGTYFRATVQRVQLTIEAIQQLFQHGGIQEGHKLLAPQNRALLQFALNVYAIGSRVWRFIQGFGKGVERGLERIRPVLTALVNAFGDLGRALGFLGDEQSRAAIAGTDMQDFFERGADLGDSLATVIGTIAQAVRGVTEFVTGMVLAWEDFVFFAQPGVILLSAAVEELFNQINAILAPLWEVVGVSTTAGSGFRSWGEVLAVIAGILVGALANAISFVVRTIMVLVSVVRLVILGFRAMWAVGETVVQALAAAFQNMADTITAVLLGLIETLGRIAEAIPQQFRPNFANDLIRAGRQATAGRQLMAERVVGRTTELGTETIGRFEALRPESMAIGENLSNAFTVGMRDALAATQERPAAAAAEATGAEAASTAAATAETNRELRRVADAGLRAAQRPIHVTVEIDGEAVGRATANANRAEAEAGGRAVGTGGG